MRHLALVGVIGVAAFATPVRSATHEITCAPEFIQYCMQYERGSPDAMYCMFRNVHRLSKSCTNALLAARLLTREQIQALEEYRLRNRLSPKGK